MASPGSYLSGGNRLSKMLMQNPDYNNGTIAGGLAHVLQQALLGYQTGKDSRDEQAAMQALTQGAGAQPWTNPDTGEQMGDAGGYEGAAYALSQLGDNPYAGRLSSQLMLGKAEQDMANQQWQQRFDEQNAAQNERWQMQNEAQNQRFQQQLAQRRELAQMTRNTALEKAKLSAQGQGKFYAVPSGDGYFLIDKGTGMAVRMGIDPNGNPVQMGAPFRPAMNPQTGQPSPLPVPGNIGIPQGQPGMQSMGDQSGVMQENAPQQGMGARPVMPPSIDPTAQQNVSSAKEQGKAEGQRIGSAPERYRAASNAMNELEAQQSIVLQDIDRAIEMAKQGGGMMGTTGVGSYMAVIPSTDAYDLSQTLNTIKANIGFDKLQAMREASPTGGALGQVSERENTLLQSVLGALDQGQSEDQFIRNLERLRNTISERQAARRAAFEQDFGGGEQRPPASNGGWSIKRVQ